MPSPRRSIQLRERVIAEIVESERTFVGGLRTGLEVFIKPLRGEAAAADSSSSSKALAQSPQHQQASSSSGAGGSMSPSSSWGPLLTREEVSSLFSNWELLLAFQSRFLADLEQAAGQPECRVGQAFKQVAPYFRMFSQYVSSYDQAVELSQDLARRNPKFSAFCDEARLDPRCHGLDLLSFLIMPVQRIPRYKLLLQELLKYTHEEHHDHKDLTEALALVSAAASHNNEQIRQRQSTRRLLELQSCLDPHSRIPVNLLDRPSRRFLRAGPLLRVLPSSSSSRPCSSKRYEAWLVSDKLLLSRTVSGGSSGGGSSSKLHHGHHGPANPHERFNVKLAADLTDLALLPPGTPPEGPALNLDGGPLPLGRALVLQVMASSSSSGGRPSSSGGQQQHSPDHPLKVGEQWVLLAKDPAEAQAWRQDLGSAITQAATQDGDAKRRRLSMGAGGSSPASSRSPISSDSKQPASSSVQVVASLSSTLGSSNKQQQPRRNSHGSSSFASLLSQVRLMGHHHSKGASSTATTSNATTISSSSDVLVAGNDGRPWSYDGRPSGSSSSSDGSQGGGSSDEAAGGGVLRQVSAPALTQRPPLAADGGSKPNNNNSHSSKNPFDDDELQASDEQQQQDEQQRPPPQGEGDGGGPRREGGSAAPTTTAAGPGEEEKREGEPAEPPSPASPSSPSFSMPLLSWREGAQAFFTNSPTLLMLLQLDREREQQEAASEDEHAALLGDQPGGSSSSISAEGGSAEAGGPAPQGGEEEGPWSGASQQVWYVASGLGLVGLLLFLL